jgi:hypothetical protein
MTEDMYKNSALMTIVKHYLSMTPSEIDLLSDKEKELINHYKDHICIK